MSAANIFLLCVLGVVIVTGEVEKVHYLSDDFIDHINSQNLPWKAGRNFDSNLTKEDIATIFGKKPNKLPERATGARKTYGLTDYLLPEEFDSRKEFKDCSSLISYIPDQGACASSFAFTIASVASDRLCVVSKGKYKKVLSAEYIASCCKMCRFPDESKVCSGGLSSSTWLWVFKRGLVTGGGYKSNIGCQPVSHPPCDHSNQGKTSLPNCNSLSIPQPKCHTRCLNKDYLVGFFHDKYRFKKFYWVSSKIEDIQKEILNYGSVVANMYIYSDFLNYKSGVYMVNSIAEMLAYTQVKLIGWGREPSSNIPYWIAVSNFGEQFGEKGTFKILRGRNEAIIEDLVIGALPKDNYAHESFKETEDQNNFENEFESNEDFHDF